MPAPVSSHDSLWRDLRGLPRAYWILFSGTFINRFGHFVMPFLALYLRSEGLADWVIVTSLMAYGAGCLLANVAGGYLADRVGRKPTILVSCSCAAVAMVALSQVHSPPLLVTFSGLVGLASSMYSPAASALLVDLVPWGLRLRAFACQRFAVNLGFAMGMATAGWMAEHVGFLPLFIIDAVTTLVLGLVVLFGVHPGPSPRTDNAGWGIALRVMCRDRAYVRAIVASFCMAMIFWQLSTTWGLHVTEVGGHAEGTYGLLMGLNGLLIVLFELPLTSFTKRHPGPRMMMWGYLLSGVGIGLSVFGGHLGLLVVVMIIFTLGEMVASPVANAYVAALAPDDMRGRYMGVLGLSWSGAVMLGPAPGIALFETSPTVLWLSCLALGLVAAALVGGIRESHRSGQSGAG